MTFLQIVRWKNLVMIAGVQALIHYHLLAVFKIDSELTHTNFALIVLASILIAAGGYIINDINDLEADKINKPESVWIPTFLTLKKGYLVYIILSMLGLVLGLFVSVSTQNIYSFIWFLAPTILLYIYAVWAKKILFLGNILVVMLIAFSMVLVVLFERIPLDQTTSFSITFNDTIIGLVVFAFLLNLVREMVKDAQDVIGDRVIKVNSIPLKYGDELTHIILQGLIGLLSGFIIVIVITYYETQIALVIYMSAAILPGILLFLSQLNKVKKPSDYKNLSKLLKLLMLAGLFSMFFIQYQN